MVAWIRLRFIDDDTIRVLCYLRPFALQTDIVNPRGFLVVSPRPVCREVDLKRAHGRELGWSVEWLIVELVSFSRECNSMNGFQADLPNCVLYAFFLCDEIDLLDWLAIIH